MGKAVHPAVEAGCTKAQVAAFEAIAVNANPGCGRKTLQALESKGLIVLGERILRSGGLPVAVPDPHVPYHIHAEWCAWCGENVTDEDIDGETADRQP